MATKISVSFKNTTKDQKLYNYFDNMEDRSTEIKIILSEWYEINIENKELANISDSKKTEAIKENKVDMDITDF